MQIYPESTSSISLTICQVSEKTNEPTSRRWLDGRMNRLVEGQVDLIFKDSSCPSLVSKKGSNK